MQVYCLADETFPTLWAAGKEVCEKDITLEELADAIKALNNNSAPGSDVIGP